MYAYSSGNGYELKINPSIPEGHGVRGSSIDKSGKASKPLDRSGENLKHVFRFIWEWTSAKKKLTSRALRGIWRGLEGSHIQHIHVGKVPNSWVDRDQIWHTYAYLSGNGHELKINPLIPEGHGGLGGHQLINLGKLSRQLDRSGPNLAHVYRFIREWT